MNNQFTKVIMYLNLPQLRCNKNIEFEIPSFSGEQSNQIAWPSQEWQQKTIKSQLVQRLPLDSYGSVCLSYKDKSINLKLIFSATSCWILLKIKT